MKKTVFSQLLMMSLIFIMTACANKDSALNRAPVEDRGSSAKTAIGQTGGSKVEIPKLGSENAGKPGYYTVKSGDRLISIALEHGQNWRDLARWNSITEPNRIEVGTVLRVAPPESAAPVATSTTGVVVTPVPVRAPPVGGATVGVPSVGASSSTAPAPPAPVKTTDELNWLWPTASTHVVQAFDGNTNKGLDIVGKAGDAILASADGRVVFTGDYRGYGKLVIIKHNDTYITAYAHNQNILVKEEQIVSKGQKIAEMGNSDSDKVKLHFEIRRQGKPVDPAKFLPAK